MVMGGFLSTIESEYGGWTLHRVTPSSSEHAHRFWAPEGVRRLMGAGQDLVEHPPGVADHQFLGDVIRLVSLNVDGLNEYASPSAFRMERILEQLLPLGLDVLFSRKSLQRCTMPFNVAYPTGECTASGWWTLAISMSLHVEPPRATWPGTEPLLMSIEGANKGAI